MHIKPERPVSEAAHEMEISSRVGGETGRGKQEDGEKGI